MDFQLLFGYRRKRFMRKTNPTEMTSITKLPGIFVPRIARLRVSSGILRIFFNANLRLFPIKQTSIIQLPNEAQYPAVAHSLWTTT